MHVVGYMGIWRGVLLKMLWLDGWADELSINDEGGTRVTWLESSVSNMHLCVWVTGQSLHAGLQNGGNIGSARLLRDGREFSS